MSAKLPHATPPPGRAGTLAVRASVMSPAPSRSDRTRTHERETSARGGGFGRAATLAVWTPPAVSLRFGFRRSRLPILTETEWPHDFRAQRRSGRVFSDMFLAACLMAGGTEVERGEAEGRRGRSRGVGSDLASPEPTSRTRGTDVGEELRKRASRSPRHCAPLPPVPQSFARMGDGKRCPRNDYEKSTLLRSCRGH